MALDVIEIVRNRAGITNRYSSYLKSLQLSVKTKNLALDKSLFREIDYPASIEEINKAIIERKNEEDIDNYLKTKRVVVLDGGDVCSICLQDLEAVSAGDDGGAGFLSCSHTFHPSCIQKWRKRKTNCPLCRHDMHEEQERRCTVKRQKVEGKSIT
ncbi:hypothetical protein MKW92_002505 [Papaver armeniacum]|nr:hypothetical protein MKW92_002505 [Papaver armeniacum]